MTSGQATICSPRNTPSASVHVRPKQVFTISEMRSLLVNQVTDHVPERLQNSGDFKAVDCLPKLQ